MFNPTSYIGSLFEHALFLLVSLSIAFLLVVLIGAIIAGIFKVATQIEDPVIGFFGKTVAAFAFLYLAVSFYGTRILEFTLRVWGGADYFF